MPTEFSRTTARKRITLPGGAKVDVPVITKISFIDPYDRYQEWQHDIDNSSASTRSVHIDNVSSDTSGTPSSAGALQVERVDKWPSVDPYDRYQETEVEFDNVTRGDNPPPYFITHLKTHVVKYFDIDGNENNFIESELIDSFVVVDPYERYQEKIYTLDNPQNDDEAQADPSDPEISDSENGIDPPWRTDPFQNIVRIGGEAITIFWAYQPEVLPGSPTVGGGYHFRDIFGNPNANTNGGVTLPDGRVGIVSGAFPVVPDVIFNPGAGVNYISFPWWFIGPNTDDSTGNQRGYNYYDIPGPSGSFSHTWPFAGYTFTDANLPAYFAPAGALSVTFGPIVFTVDGVPWTLTNTHVAFTALAEADRGASPILLGWQPYFEATFEPPTA